MFFTKWMLGLDSTFREICASPHRFFISHDHISLSPFRKTYQNKMKRKHSSGYGCLSGQIWVSKEKRNDLGHPLVT
ncbi:hypothetical protein TNIN_67201 [Trichonephila inaurata madagascariensis]|uniref:Uncharacterized protein n=1 Tax=Trichonephila inaurata madagascariensis TaxID=2747483 RepID=A0A8X6MED5_9ARAC|nr:hypothetical protein TNIN_67201 [Trichonephila inaurata madagascariensis]